MGRFSHEALAFDPATGDVYETEDNGFRIDADPDPRARGNSGFYCFRANWPLGGVGSLEAGGQLFILQAKDPITGDPVDDLRDPECFSEYDVEWIPIEEPNAAPVGFVSGPYTEGRSKGATRFQRLEGCWWDAINQCVVFVDTEAGRIGAQPGRTDRAEGAIWKYSPRTKRLRNIFVSKGASEPDAYGADNPDNVSVSPRGGIMMCEDGGRDDGNGLSLLGLLPNGQSFEFARNSVILDNSDAQALMQAGHNPAMLPRFPDDYTGQEWAGATFSPDGRWLFVNIQTPGITFAITGPWQKGPF